MTPEELLRKLQDIAYSYKYSDVEKYNLHIELIRQAKSEWCKKQRINCADMIDYNKLNGNINEILNAPEPE